MLFLRRNTKFNKLGIKTAQDLMKYFKDNLNYGFVYKNKIFTDLKPDFQKNMDKLYKIRLGLDFIKNKYGVCWDFCQLERFFFLQNNIEHTCYFIESYINCQKGGPTHTFALYQQNDKWYWFEYSWFYHRGIWEYSSKEEALKDILLKFEKFFGKKLFNIKMYKTDKVTKRLDAFQFVEHCLKGQKVEIDKK